jgi:ABC-type multidrug transport system fused ATPase/permease subunit
LSIFANTMANKYAYKQKERIEHAERQATYFNNVGYDFTYGKDIRMYDLKDKLRKDFRKTSNSYLAIFRDIQNNAFGWAMFDILTLLIQDGLAYYLIISGYFDGRFSLGTMSAYIGAVIGLTTCLKAISKHFADLSNFTRYMGDFYAFLDDRSLFSFNGTASRLEGSFDVEFRDVSFKYPNASTYAMRHLNLKIAKGEKLALVGANGAGKTTLVKLLTGLFTPDEGEILIGGVNIQTFAQKELQAMFGVVFQDFTIYAANVLENVMGVDQVGEDQALEAIRMVGLKDKIATLPKKAHQPMLKVIEDDGVELSGGENQKLAIARALYKDANMIILDEPTSALDALAEEAIYRDFDGLVKGKTAIYVSHRLSSTKFCNHIALLSPEGLAEYGTHDALMALKGQYYHMFVTQGRYYQSKEANLDEKL